MFAAKSQFVGETYNDFIGNTTFISKERDAV